VTDDVDFTVIQRRAGKFYGLRGGARHGLTLDGAGMAELSTAQEWRNSFMRTVRTPSARRETFLPT
jgi:hypothetical protein